VSALPTRIESQAGRSLTAGEIFEIMRAREKSLSRLPASARDPQPVNHRSAPWQVY
jgi:hypothetical protein